LILYYPFFFLPALKVAVNRPEYPSELFPKSDLDCPDRIGLTAALFSEKQSPCQFTVAVTVANLSIYMDKNVTSGVRREWLTAI
jgi:hypothetical protein